jgi:hypothetical protein
LGIVRELAFLRKTSFIPLDHLLQNFRRGNSGKVGARAAVASDSPKRIGSWAGFPNTAWSTSLIWISTRPFASATGPRLPAWQSPQIHTGGPSGSEWRRLRAEPFVEFQSAPSHVCVCGTRHFFPLARNQEASAILRGWEVVFHGILRAALLDFSISRAFLD